MNRKTRHPWKSLLAIVVINIAIIAAIVATLNSANAHTAPVRSPQPESSDNGTEREIPVIVDDFVPDFPEADSIYGYNRLDGNRGVVNNSLVNTGNGQLTNTIAPGQSWGGFWESLNHPIAEALTIDFSAALPPQISSTYQSRITGITAKVITGTKDATFRLELKDRDGVLKWNKETTLTGGPQIVTATLPSLGDIKEFLWVLDNASAGDYVVVDSVSLTATTRITDTATAAFVWSYGMLLNNWDPETGLVRDKGRHESGEFDAIQATGSLAAATALAAQLGIVEPDNARQIVTTISNTLLNYVPRFHGSYGLWPHFVNSTSPISATGAITIAPGTEWSSVDTVIAAIGLLDAQSGLGMDTSGTEAMIRSINWVELERPGGISHGYLYNGDPITSTWNVFGGESWLVELAHASATSQVTSLTYPTPPTANGSGFIDELAWLFVLPPTGLDYWGNVWEEYRLAATYTQTQYYPTNYPGECFDQLGLFGLSAAEVPTPWAIPPGDIYQAFGVGGRFTDPNDGSWLLGAPVVTPHYAAMIAALRPGEAIDMWTWLIDETPFSPLNNVESLMFPAGSSCDPEDLEWNHLKGSWNLALQTLGLGNYLVQRNGETPVTWQTTYQNAFIRHGYSILVPKIYLPIIAKP